MMFLRHRCIGDIEGVVLAGQGAAGGNSMRTVNILSLQRSTAADQAKIRAVDPAVRLTDAGGWFDGEIRDTWSDYAIQRYLTPGSAGSGTREERDRLLAEAEIVIGGWPFPRDLPSRAPRPPSFPQ